MSAEGASPGFCRDDSSHTLCCCIRSCAASPGPSQTKTSTASWRQIIPIIKLQARESGLLFFLTQQQQPVKGLFKECRANRRADLCHENYNIANSADKCRQENHAECSDNTASYF